jgi:GNAT superfamily N-acetyltransferase
MIVSEDLIRKLEYFEASRVELSAGIFGGDVLKVGGGIAAFCGDGNVATQAVGVGVGHPITRSDFDAILAHYAGRCKQFEFKLSVIAPLDLREWVVQRALSLPEFEGVLIQDISALVPLGVDMDIRLVGPDQAREYAERTSRWFFPDAESPGLVELIEKVCVGKSTRSFLVFMDDKPVAGCSFGFQDGVGSLGGAAVDPDYRGRGIHKAMQAHRMALAKSLGCKIVTQGALAGSISQQNAQKSGFQIAYTRPTFMVRA